jgi:RNase adapter protein RapZ
VSEFIVIAGLSGAGRSQAADILEDLGWFVIDNMPPALIPKVSELAQSPGDAVNHVALVVGTGRYHDEVLPALAALRAQGAPVRILFLDASTEVLVRRYESTRRRHPLAAGQSLDQAIQAERRLLEPVKAEADVVVDTSDTNIHQLRQRIVDLFGGGVDAEPMQVTIVSFGYKHGLPLDADVVIDCRFLPNPHWVEDLRPRSGLDDAVVRYLDEQEVTGPFIEQLHELVRLLLPNYVGEGKSYLTLAFGCTGGRHRSVAVAERMAELLADDGYRPRVTHRDLER